MIMATQKVVSCQHLRSHNSNALYVMNIVTKNTIHVIRGLVAIAKKLYKHIITYYKYHKNAL